MHLKNTASSIIGFAKIRTSILISGFFYLGMFSIASDSPNNFQIDRNQWFQILFAMIALGCSYLNAGAINDIADRKIDLINLAKAKNRPLVSGKISIGETFFLAGLSGFIAVISSLLISRIAAIITIGVLAFNVIYSFRPIRLSYRGITPLLLLPGVYVAYPMFLSRQVFDIVSPTFNVCLVGMYLLFTSRLFLKDLRDIEGDTIWGKRTFVIRYGQVATISTSMGFLVGGSIFLSIAFFKEIDFVLYSFWFLIAGSLRVLMSIMKATTFKEQGPLLSVYGRLQTGCLLVAIAYLVCKTYSVSELNTSAICILLATATYMSSRDIYNTASEKSIERSKQEIS